MPTLPPKPCHHPGCPSLVYDGSGYCADHQGDKVERYQRDDRRTSSQRGYDAHWRKVRALKLRMNPLCERCGMVAQVVHHIKEVDARPDLRLDLGNLESLCRRCHEIEHGRLRG